MDGKLTVKKDNGSYVSIPTEKGKDYAFCAYLKNIGDSVELMH